MERARGAVQRDPADQLGKIFHIEHAATVFEFRKDRQSARQRDQRVVIAPATGAVDHRRAENSDAEGVVRQRVERVFRVQLALAVGVGRSGRRVGRDGSARAGRRCLTKDDHAGQKDELAHAVRFGLGGQLGGQTVVDQIVLFRQRRVGSDVGDASAVEHRVVSGEIHGFPAVATQADGGAVKFRRRLLHPRANRAADEAVSAGDQQLRHRASPPLRAGPRPRGRRRGEAR